jgi:hypothetical protein
LAAFEVITEVSAAKLENRPIRSGNETEKPQTCFVRRAAQRGKSS